VDGAARSRRNSRTVDFGTARDEGLANLDAIADQTQGGIGLSKEEIELYLTENISGLSEEMEKGLLALL
jgi:hypothetical protein